MFDQAIELRIGRALPTYGFKAVNIEGAHRMPMSARLSVVGCTLGASIVSRTPVAPRSQGTDPLLTLDTITRSAGGHNENLHGVAVPAGRTRVLLGNAGGAIVILSAAKNLDRARVVGMP